MACRNERYPVGLPSASGEFANIATAMGVISAAATNLRLQSSGSAKSNAVWMLAVCVIMRWARRPRSPR
jgi:hypothetical protein